GWGRGQATARRSHISQVFGLPSPPSRPAAGLPPVGGRTRMTISDYITPQLTEDLPPFEATPDMIREHARLRPDAIAVKCERHSITWGAFDRRLNKVARALLAHGVRKGDKVAALAVNSIEYLELFMGTLRAGACMVPLSTMGAADALEGMMDNSD